MKLNITSGRLSIFLITCIALSNAVVFAKGHSKELFDKFCGHSLILKGGEPAINPATTLPYVFIFVDNTNPKPGDGTFKNPYSTLAAAQAGSLPNDIIYVFPGNGTDLGYNTGFFPQAGQQLLGAGIKQKLLTTEGCVKIPAQAKELSILSNTFAPTPFDAVTLSAGDNVVSGFKIFDKYGGGPGGAVVSGGIVVANGLNYLIKDNKIYTNNFLGNGGGNCINIHGGGNVTVKKNILIGQDTSDTYGVDMLAFVNPLEGTYVFEKNLCTGADANSGLARGIHIEPGDQFGFIGNSLSVSLLYNISNSQTNTVSPGDSPRGFSIRCNAPVNTFVTLVVKGNQVYMPATVVCTSPSTLPSNCSGFAFLGFGPGPLIATIKDNIAITTDGTPGYFLNNRTANTATPAFTIEIVEFDNNVGTIQVV